MREENQLGLILASLRKRRGWDQEQTAAWLGVARHTYSDWETGKRFPTDKQRNHIATKFELSQQEQDELNRAAGQLPLKSPLLPPRNPFFTGRESHLERLGELLKETGAAAITQSISISGLGGIGKSELALEYAHRSYPDVYREVLWIYAADETTLQGSYAKVAQHLALPELNERDPERCVEAVKEWLARNPRWLLIMDNADDLPLAASFLPSRPRGHILLTTRSQFAGTLAARQIEIDKMELEEGLVFLLRRSRKLEVGAALNTVAAAIHEPARQLVSLLDGHPLALDQAGAYIEETRVSFAAYIDLYHEQRRSMLERRDAFKGKLSVHPDSVFVTLKLSFDKAFELHPLASDILHFFAFLQPDDIPAELFLYDESLKRDSVAVGEGYAALHRYSLIKRVQEYSLSVHRLVQAVLIEDRMSLSIRKQWRERVVRALCAACPQVEFKYWWNFERLLPHALVCAVWPEDELTPTATIEVGDLFHEVGIYLRLRERYSEAETLLERACSIYEKHLGIEHTTTANGLNDLANAYINQGKYEQAEQLLERAVSIRANQFGAEHHETATIQSNLANLYHLQGKYEQAERLYQQAISIQEKHLGVEHPDVAWSIHNLAALYILQGNHEQAELLLLRAVSILEKQSKAEHPEIAAAQNKLASIYFEQGKYEQAAYWYEQAISDQGTQSEAVHPAIAEALIKLAFILHGFGEHMRAEALYRRSMSIEEQLFGATDPRVQATKKIYADYLHSIGRDAEDAELEVDDEPLG